MLRNSNKHSSAFSIALLGYLFAGHKSTWVRFVYGQSAVYPTLRFIPWDQNDRLDAAITLGYNSTLWDNTGTNPIEMMAYSSLSSDPAVEDAINRLGMDKSSWDCYINHYRGYTWPNLANTYKNAYRVLGWTHESWNNIIDPPESESFTWNMLNSEQQDAAQILCYFEELWDTIPLDEWNIEQQSSMPTNLPTRSPVSTNNPTMFLFPSSVPSLSPISTTTPPVTITPTFVPEILPSKSPLTTSIPTIAIFGTINPTIEMLSASVLPTMLPSTQLTIPIPYFRYIPWSTLNDDTRILAILLGYTAETWDVPGMATIETLSFDMIKNSNESRRIAYIEALGYSKPSWDCYITHYRAYDWNMLNQTGVQEYYITLGWTEQLWNNGGFPTSEKLEWMDLNLSERIAAESLCYFEPTWNRANLQDEVAWKLPSTSLSSSSISWFWPSRTALKVAATCLLSILAIL